MAYQLDELTIANQEYYVYDKTMIWFENEEGSVQFNTQQPSELMVLAAQPIGEKVNHYGPFVMNEKTEVLEAIRDAQMGKMGVLIEDF